MKKLLCFLFFVSVINTATAQYTALRISNNTNCDLYVGVEMTDFNHTCSNLFDIANAIPSAAGSGSVVYSDMTLNAMGYTISPYSWDSDPLGLNTQVARIKVSYNIGLSGCTGDALLGSCTGSGNGPVTFSAVCGCNGGNAPTVTISTVTNSPWNYTLILIAP